MCYTSQQVLRKEFDYSAYIQGRLRGEYVVIYHTVVDEPVCTTSEEKTDEELLVEPDIFFVILIPNTSLHSLTAIKGVEPSFTASFNFFQNRLATKIGGLNILTTATCANCRGAP
jgi:hypothetical protein